MRPFFPLFLAFMLPTISFAESQTINLLEFKTDDPQAWETAQRKSESLPLTLDELDQLKKAGIGESTCNEMIRTRGVLALLDAETMVALKKKGYSDAMLAQLSAYAVKPNDHLTVDLTLTLSTPDSLNEAPFAYIELWSEAKNRQEAFIYADLRQVPGKETSNRQDRVLGETARTIHRTLPIRTRGYGPMTLRFATSQQSNLTQLKDLSKQDLPNLQSFSFTYPGASLEHRCALNLELTRDRVLKDRFTVRHSDWTCYWD